MADISADMVADKVTNMLAPMVADKVALHGHLCGSSRLEVPPARSRGQEGP